PGGDHDDRMLRRRGGHGRAAVREWPPGATRCPVRLRAGSVIIQLSRWRESGLLPPAARPASAAPPRWRKAEGPPMPSFEWNKIIPNPCGAMEENIASVPNYQFSQALLAHKSEKWDPDKLNVWLFKPQSFAKGTKMTFPGLPKTQDRADVVAYLESLK